MTDSEEEEELGLEADSEGAIGGASQAYPLPAQSAAGAAVMRGSAVGGGR